MVSVLIGQNYSRNLYKYTSTVYKFIYISFYRPLNLDKAVVNIGRDEFKLVLT